MKLHMHMCGDCVIVVPFGIVEAAYACAYGFAQNFGNPEVAKTAIVLRSCKF